MKEESVEDLLRSVQSDLKTIQVLIAFYVIISIVSFGGFTFLCKDRMGDLEFKIERMERMKRMNKGCCK